MKYSPDCENTRPLMITIFLTVAAIFSMMFASEIQSLKWLFQLLFLCLATAAIQIFLKYVLTTYEYVCDSENLLVYKAMGRKKILLASLSLDKSLLPLLTKDEFDKLEEKPIFDSSFVYTRNYKTKNISFYFFRFDEKTYMFKLEFSEDFRRYVNSIIASKIEREI